MERKRLKARREPAVVKRLALLACALVLAGCTASGDDPFAYTRKPLYAGGFDLARLAGGADAQEFRVTDGSIAEIRVQVWVNASAGGGHVTLLDPGGRTVLDTREATTRSTGLELGVWSVHVDAPPGSEGLMHILVTRA